MAQKFMPTIQTSSFVDMLTCSDDVQPSSASFIASQQLQTEANIHSPEVLLQFLHRWKSDPQFVQQKTETAAVEKARFPLVSDGEILALNLFAASRNTARATKTESSQHYLLFWRSGNVCCTNWTGISESKEAINDFISKRNSAISNSKKGIDTDALTLRRHIVAYSMTNERIESQPSSELDHLLSNFFMYQYRQNGGENERDAQVKISYCHHYLKATENITQHSGFCISLIMTYKWQLQLFLTRIPFEKRVFCHHVVHCVLLFSGPLYKITCYGGDRVHSGCAVLEILLCARDFQELTDSSQGFHRVLTISMLGTSMTLSGKTSLATLLPSALLKYM